MRYIKFVLFAAFIFAFLSLGSAPSTTAHAQVYFGLNVGPAPVCPYGYYDFPPYDCAPYGYYGPEWFNNGFFIGTGPWFHGPANFRGNVNNHFDVRNGYHGALPARGSHMGAPAHAPAFHGNEMHDGGGHMVGGGRK